MKKLLAPLLLLACMLVVCSCDPAPAAVYNNFYRGCTLGSTVYVWRGMKAVSFNAVTGGPRSLCYDPLCTHDGGEFCLQDEMLFVFDIKTDGVKLYINLSDLRDASFGTTTCVYSFDTGTGKLEKLVEYDATSGFSDRIDYMDGYIYYTEAVYPEAEPADAGYDKYEDALHAFMRIKTSGGKPERVFAENYPSDVEFFVDSKNYYLIAGDMTAVDRENGSKRTVDSSGILTPLAVIETKSGSYLYGVSEVWEPDSGNGNPAGVTSRGTAHALFRIGDTLEKVADGMAYTAFGGDIMWYTSLTEKDGAEYIGTVKSPTGKGSEVASYDIFLVTDGTLTRYDLDTGEKNVYAFEDRYFSPFIYGAVGETLIAGNYNPLKYYNDTTDGVPYVRLTHDGGRANVEYFD